jgi:acetyl-CoA carboxylase carboxyl transferase subunit beta
MADAFIGFSGPRVVQAMTGRPLPPGSGTAEAALAAGLVDAVADGSSIEPLLAGLLKTLRPDDPLPVDAPAAMTPPDLGADAQVASSRTAERPSGQQLLETTVDERFAVRGADENVAAVVGRLAGRRVVAVALGATRGAMPGPGGFALLARCAALAGSLRVRLVVLVDTPGADPHTEADGLSPAIADGLLGVLATPAPTVSLVHGEGGSGGALAGAVTDVVGVGRYGWFAALGPEGAAAALRIEPAEASRRMRITPADLLADGFADAYVSPGHEAGWIAAEFGRLAAMDDADRLTRRVERWSNPLAR